MKKLKSEEDPELVDEIFEKVSILLENKKTLKQMAENTKYEVTNGKFSLKKRNKKLRRIYETSL